MTSLGTRFHVRTRIGRPTHSDCLKKCRTRFPGDHCPHDQCRHPPLATALHLWHISQHDTLRASLLHPDGVHQDHRSHFRSCTSFLLIFQYCYRRTVRSTQSPQVIRTRMLPAYFTALGTQSSAATIPVTLEQTKKERSISRYCRFRRPPLRHHPSFRQYTERL